MESKERAMKDINKLESILSECVRHGFDRKFPEVYEYASNYYNDARHFFEKKDYFSAFGAANYAYGFVDCIFVLEGKKDDTNVF